MGVLSAMIVGVLWLVLYFRNNAFKSFYPLKRGRLVAEAALTFVTCLGLTTLIPAYQGGAYTHMRALTRGTDLVREANVVNLAHHFIPFSRAAFASSNDCNYRKSYIEDDEHRMHVEDSLEQERQRNPAVDTFSYLHYCNNDVNVYDLPGIRSERGNDSVAKRWLLGGAQDSVRIILKEYLAIAKKYSARYRFDADAQVREIFAEPGFPVRREVSASPYLYGRPEAPGDNRKDELFIEHQKITEAINATDEARKGWLDTGMALFLLYWSLGLALAIFSFRITAVRPWFIALIGSGIWGAIFGVLGAFIGRMNSGYLLTLIVILLSLSFLTAAIYLIREKLAKRNAGVSYLWALWSLPSVVPLFFAWLEHLTAPKDFYNAKTGVTTYEPAPFHDWINHNWPLIGFGNFVLFMVLLVALFIPLARKWQAMTEE